MIRQLLNTPVNLETGENVREVFELAHAVMMGPYNMAQKKVALRKLDELTGIDDQPVDEAAIQNYISVENKTR